MHVENAHTSIATTINNIKGLSMEIWNREWVKGKDWVKHNRYLLSTADVKLSQLSVYAIS